MPAIKRRVRECTFMRSIREEPLFFYLTLLSTLIQNLTFAATMFSPGHYLKSSSWTNLKPTVDMDTTSSAYLQKRGRGEILESTRVKTFITEPNVEAVTFDFLTLTNDTSQLAPGYLFLTIQGPYRNVLGGHIYDNKGTLIWHGYRRQKTQDLHVCDYLGQRGRHLCVHKWHPWEKEILDLNYQVVGKTYRGEMDSHEFNPLPGGNTFIDVLNNLISYDLTPYTGDKNGYVMDACLWDIEVETFKPVFKWCYLDHLPIWATNVWIKQAGPLGDINRTRASTKAKYGTKEDPWDFAHINSGDLVDGDYYMGFRHLDQIIKVAGRHNRHGIEAGTVLWRLGGTGSDFELRGFNFSRQHHARVQSVTTNETVISLFNNAWEGTNEPTSDRSSGQIIRLNNVTMKAELVHDYSHPSAILSPSRGSTQVLSNGNVLVGYGRFPDIIEHAADGTILSHIRFSRFRHGDSIERSRYEFSYRAYKQDWVGRPREKPKLVVYSRTCTFDESSPLISYISWNGDTEVVTWRFLVGIAKDGPWLAAGTFNKDNFEVRALLSFEGQGKRFMPWVRVEGIDSNGKMLTHRTERTFVPAQPEEWECDAYGCHNPFPFKYNHKFEENSLRCGVEETPKSTTVQDTNLTPTQALTFADSKPSTKVYPATFNKTISDKLKTGIGTLAPTVHQVEPLSLMVTICFVVGLSSIIVWTWWWLWRARQDVRGQYQEIKDVRQPQ